MPARRSERRLLSAYDLDHVMFVGARPESVLAACESAGLTHRPPKVQPGTGAAHALVFFDNAYLEFAWDVTGGEAFMDAPRMHFQSRTAWRETGWCPFGLSFRAAPSAPTTVPIPSWGYAAPFLPEGATPIPFGANSEHPGEPLLITSLVSGRPDAYSPTPPLQHDLGLHELTALTLTLQSRAPSPELTTVCSLLPITLRQGPSPHLEMIFDGGRTGAHLHLTDDIPITLCW